jgi:hypothetical protein
VSHHATSFHITIVVKILDVLSAALFAKQFSEIMKRLNSWQWHSMQVIHVKQVIQQLKQCHELGIIPLRSE